MRGLWFIAVMLIGQSAAAQDAAFVEGWIERCFAKADVQFEALSKGNGQKDIVASQRAAAAEGMCKSGPQMVCENAARPDACLRAATAVMRSRQRAMFAQLPVHIDAGPRILKRYRAFREVGGKWDWSKMRSRCLVTQAKYPRFAEYPELICDLMVETTDVMTTRFWHRRVLLGINE